MKTKDKILLVILAIIAQYVSLKMAWSTFNAPSSPEIGRFTTIEVWYLLETIITLINSWVILIIVQAKHIDK